MADPGKPQSVFKIYMTLQTFARSATTLFLAAFQIIHKSHNGHVRFGFESVDLVQKRFSPTEKYFPITNLQHGFGFRQFFPVVDFYI